MELPAETFILLRRGKLSAAAHICKAIRQMLPPHGGQSQHKTGSCVPRTEWVATLHRLPKHLTECQSDSSAVTASHNFNSRKTTNRQSIKLKVASPVSDKRTFLLEPCDVSLNPVTRETSCITLPSGKNCAHIRAQERNEKVTLKSWMAGHWQCYISRREGSPTWSPLRLRMLDSSISPSAFSEPLTTV